MNKSDVYNMQGEKTSSLTLDERIFKHKPKMNLLHQVVTSQLANSRKPYAHTKTRGEVSGGGIKPWKQKGTGRARAGSSRSPIWIGGGVTFGPRKKRNYLQKTNKKVKKIALTMALSVAYQDKKIIIVDKIHFDKIKTKQAENFLQKLPIKEGTILMIVSESEQNLLLSTRNLSYLKTINSNCLNVLDIIKHDWIVIEREAFAKIEKNLFGELSNIKRVSTGELRKDEVKPKTSDKKIVKTTKATVKNSKKAK